MRGAPRQTVQIPLVTGLNQRLDPRALDTPSLALAKDIMFDDLGGIQTRLPFGATMTAISPSGTIANARRLYEYGDEIVLFTKDTVYTRNAQAAKWVSRGTHLAVKVDEKPVFVTTGDQIDGDRAELSNVIVYVWVAGSDVHAAAVDKITGATIVAPTAIASRSRPRLVALSTKILLFLYSTPGGGDEIVVRAIDPADPAAGFASAETNAVPIGAANLFYDVVRVPGTDTAIGVARRATTTSYEIFKVTAALAVTNATKARTADGPLAIACEPTATQAQVIRANGTNIQGDRITISSLADEATGQAVGTVAATPVNQIAAAHRSTQDGGAYRCYAFWSSSETAQSLGFQSKSNYVDTAGVIGTQAVLELRLGVVSRAFDHEGRVFVWMVFAGESGAAGMGEPLGIRAQLQNTYYLYRDDGTYHAKAVWAKAGGFAASTGRLPHVALTGGATEYTFCGTERRVIALGGASHMGYADRGPRDIACTFDSNEARRCARAGATLYVSGADLLQYDGEGLTEVGFEYYPWLFSTVIVDAGNLPDGKYSYKATVAWQNAKGEREQSTTATGEQVAVTTGPDKVDFSVAPIHVTKKRGARQKAALKLWRTKKDPLDDSPFYLITAVDPNTVTGDNRYIPNDPTLAFAADGLDNLTDALLEEREQNPENGGVLESLAPPSATIIAASASRVFLAGVPGEPHQVWYSRQRGAGEIASFHDINVVDLSVLGGEITGIVVLDGVPIVFKERAIVELVGLGYDNIGGGLNYEVRDAPGDVGAVSAEAIAATQIGIVFKSTKGWYRYARGGVAEYIGGPVADYDSDTVHAIHVVEDRHEIRILTSARMLVLDYLANAWVERTIADGIHAAIWDGTYHYLTSTGPKAELEAHGTNVTYGLDVELAWYKPAELQGQGRVSMIQVLGEYRSTFKARVRVARDYRRNAGDTGWLFFDDVLWTPTPTGVGGPLQVKHPPSRQQMQAAKIRITAVATATAPTLATATGLLSGVTPIRVASGATWTATLEGRELGTGQNGLAVKVYATSGSDVEVRDGESFTGSGWVAFAGGVGIRVGDSATVRELEAAIDQQSNLVHVKTPDTTSAGQAVNDANATFDGSLAGGTLTWPTGEALKLTGVGMDVAAKRGLYRRLPSTQRV